MPRSGSAWARTATWRTRTPEAAAYGARHAMAAWSSTSPPGLGRLRRAPPPQLLDKPCNSPTIPFWAVAIPSTCNPL
jgi:hypothetical protein